MSRNYIPKILKDLGTQRIQRINWIGFAIVGGLLLFGLIAYFPATFLVNRTVRNSAISQAEQAWKIGDVDLALRHLQRYLGDHPDDIPALEFKAKILSDPSVFLPWTQLIDAASTLDQLIRLDPKGEGRLETRRKLAEFYIRYSDELKRYADSGTDPDVERQQSRYAAAASIAGQLVENSIKENYPDGVAHRLLARAYEGQISDIRGKLVLINETRKAERMIKDGEVEDLRLKAIKNYKLAIEIDSHDLESPTRLANLYLTWTRDQATADSVLEAMLKANPKSVEARLARFRAFSVSSQDKVREKLAQDELKALLELDPGNSEVRIEVASVALGKRENAEARRQLDAIPAAKQDDLRVKILRGYMEFAESHPEDAIDQWRRGLMLVGGSNQDLTWKLAFNLVQLGRYKEADPLRERYAQLSKGDKNGMGKYLDALFDIGYGRLYEARRKLEKIKDIVQPSLKADVLLSLGRCCDMMGDVEAALMAYRNASTASPSSVGPRLAIARHLMRRHPDEAIVEVDRAIQDSPRETNLLLEAIRLRLSGLVGKSFIEPSRARQIEELIAKVEAIDPTNQTLVSYRAEYMTVSGQLPKAVESLAEAVKGSAKRSPEVWITLAQGLDRLNRRNDALKALDEASLPQNVGDRVKIRIAKSRILARAGKGQDARAVLAHDPEKVALADRPELAQALGELLRELGDRDGALAAFADWAKLAPKVPGPALALLAMAQIDNDDRAAKLGLAALKLIGGDREPYGMAARALDLMRVDPSLPNSPPPADRLYEAELLVKSLRQDVPSLRFGSLLEGMIQEYRGNLEGAVKSYKTAQKDDILSPALPKLIEVFIKSKRWEELERLKQEFNHEVEARQRPGLAAEFDRISAAVALKLGDKDRAEYFASRLLDGRRDSVAARTTYAWMLDSNNETGQAEESLKTLVKEKPNDAMAWLTLISFQALRKTPADVARTIGQARREYTAERPELFLAQCYWQGKDVPNAKIAYKKAIEVRPDDVVTLRSLVQFFADSSQADQIEPVLRKILKIDPSTNWAARMLAMMISANSDPATWPEAWSLVAPGSSAAGDTPEDRLTRATVLARSPESNRRKEAVSAFTALANDLPISSPLAIDTRVRLSQAMIDINQFGEAWDAIRPISEDTARPNAVALVLAIEALARSGRPDEAERRLDRLTNIDPKSPQVPLSSCWIFLARGKKPEAIAAIESAANESSNAPNAEVVAMLALNRLIKFGDTETSLRVAKTIAARWPAQSWGLARVYNLRQEFDLSLAQCEAALDAGSVREAAGCAVAAAIGRRSDPSFLSKVDRLVEKAQMKAPKDYNIPVSLATLRHIQDRYEDELACYRKALELSPSNVQFLNNMAWTLSEALNRPQEAIKCVQEAISRDGEVSFYLDTRGVVEERLGQFDKAIADLEKSIQIDPSPTTYFHLARAYFKAKDVAASKRCRDLAIKANFDRNSLDPTDRADLDAVMGNP